METPIEPLHPAIETAIGRKVRRGIRSLPRRTQRRWFVAAVVVGDVCLLALAMFLAHWIRFYLDAPFFEDNAGPQPTLYFELGLLLVPIWIGLFWAYRLYDYRRLLGGTQEYSAIFQASGTGVIVLVMLQFLSRDFVIARGWVALVWVLAFVLIVAGRFTLRRVGYAARRKGLLVSPTLILGANEEGRLLGQQLLTWPTSGMTVLGFLDDTLPVGTRVCGNLYVLGPLASLEDKRRQYGVDELIVAASAMSRDVVLDIFRHYGAGAGVNVRMSSGLFELLTTPLDVQELAYVPLIGVSKARLTGLEVLLKTALDYTATTIGLLLLSPLFLALALIVRLDSPGPILYRRRVMGMNGRQFDALKFRTMRVDGDAILAAHPALRARLAREQKLKDDPRITRVGGALRKFSLDELPQLLNVLKGDMSLVGPRMISPPELAQYGQWGMNLLTVRPGLTGLWQVSGRSDISYADRVRLDMHYIRNYSIWLDLQLIWQTIPVVFGGRGAY
ncbi:MAG: sugar transferase [Anaerolineae bacterium]